MRKAYLFRPMQHALSTAYPDLNMPFTHAAWGAKNFKIDQRSISKRWGYSEDRDLEAPVYDIILYALKGGTRHTLYLTDTDLCKKETASGKTFSYKTDTYTTGTISSITGTAVVGSGTTWTSAMVGDYFIMDSDHTADEEPDSNWTEISAFTDATHITLASSYTKNGTTYKIRHVYSVPANERWWWAIVDDKFIFGNGDINVQSYTGSNYAADLNATYAVKARYGIEYVDRLVIADHGSTRDPLGWACSKNLDPTNWTDSAADSGQFLETKDFITGLGKGAGYIYVYRRDSMRIGNPTGLSSTPIGFPQHVRGTGNIAPSSIIEVKGTNAFLGKEDFYIMDANRPTPIGEAIRDKFFDIVDLSEAENTWGYNNILENEATWVATTSEGKLAFIWNYKQNEWYVNSFADDIMSYGTGHK